MAVERVLVTPRWGGSPESDWYPWIEEQVGELVEVRRLPLPEADAPTVAGCIDAFGRALGEGNPARTLLVGHSVSVQGWLHTLAARDEPVAGLLGVAGWWSVDESWPTIEPWLDAELDLDAVRERCPRVRILLSTNDPFTADHEANAALWRERLGARVDIVPDAEHFNAAREPAVLQALRALLE